MQKLQQIKSNQQSKYGEIIEYLKQDNGYWLENDKWDLTKEFFNGKKVYSTRYFGFSAFEIICYSFDHFILLEQLCYSFIVCSC